MSKERIAEIKNKFRGFLNQSERSTIAISQNHLNLLIEQAERAQELEDILEQDARQGVLEGLYEENKRYREGVEKALRELSSYNPYEQVHYDMEAILLKLLEGDPHD